MLLPVAELGELVQLDAQVRVAEAAQAASGCWQLLRGAWIVGFDRLRAEVETQEEREIYDVSAVVEQLRLLVVPLRYTLRTGECMSPESDAVRRAVEAAGAILSPPGRNWPMIVLGGAGLVSALLFIITRKG